MTLDDEIEAVEDVVRTARGAATEHLARATEDLRLRSATLARYRDFLDATVQNAELTLARCREVAAVPAETSARIAQGLLAGARESVRLLYVAMSVVEDLAGSVPPPGTTPGGTNPRSCSFCGKTEAETKLVAGPSANICGDCTRLACGVLGIPPSS
jgi:hypothetical protein